MSGSVQPFVFCMLSADSLTLHYHPPDCCWQKNNIRLRDGTRQVEPKHNITWIQTRRPQCSSHTKERGGLIVCNEPNCTVYRAYCLPPSSPSRHLVISPRRILYCHSLWAPAEMPPLPRRVETTVSKHLKPCFRRPTPHPAAQNPHNWCWSSVCSKIPHEMRLMGCMNGLWRGFIILCVSWLD